MFQLIVSVNGWSVAHLAHEIKKNRNKETETRHQINQSEAIISNCRPFYCAFAPI